MLYKEVNTYFAYTIILLCAVGLLLHVVTMSTIYNMDIMSLDTTSRTTVKAKAVAHEETMKDRTTETENTQ